LPLQLLPVDENRLLMLLKADMLVAIPGGNSHWSAVVAVKPGQSKTAGRGFFHFDSMSEGACRFFCPTHPAAAQHHRRAAAQHHCLAQLEHTQTLHPFSCSRVAARHHHGAQHHGGVL
jgi:hypothetical protein